MASIIDKTFYVDMWNPNYIKTIALQREALGRELRFYITSDSIPVNLTGITVLIYAKKPDNTSIYATCTKITEISGYCSITMDSQFMAVKGNVQCWLKLISSTGNVISPSFNIEVLETPDIDTIVESLNEFSALTAAIATAYGLEPRIAALETTDQDHAGRIAELETEILDPAPLVGEIKMWPGTAAPPKFAICDGSAVSRTTYSVLYAVLGTLYGTGDGSTTFNLPNLKGRVPVGYDSSQTAFDALGETGGEKTHTLTINEMPDHNHGISSNRNIYYSPTGTAGLANSPVIGAGVDTGVTTPQGGNAAHNNLQPYIVVNYIIRAVE